MMMVPSGLKAGKLRCWSICTKLGSSPNTDPEIECVCVQGVRELGERGHFVGIRTRLASFTTVPKHSSPLNNGLVATVSCAIVAANPPRRITVLGAHGFETWCVAQTRQTRRHALSRSENVSAVTTKSFASDTVEHDCTFTLKEVLRPNHTTTSTINRQAHLSVFQSDVDGDDVRVRGVHQDSVDLKQPTKHIQRTSTKTVTEGCGIDKAELSTLLNTLVVVVTMMRVFPRSLNHAINPTSTFLKRA